MVTSVRAEVCYWLAVFALVAVPLAVVVGQLFDIRRERAERKRVAEILGRKR